MLPEVVICTGLCKVFGVIPTRHMMIHLQTNESVEYFVIVSDPSASNSFQMPYSLMTGDKVRLKASTDNTAVAYSIQLTKTSTETADGSCFDYTNHEHKSYSDCVDAEMRNKILPTLGCMIPWMSRTDACAGHIQRMPKHEALLEWIINLLENSWGGIQYKSHACPLPCTLFSAYSTFQASVISNGNKIFLHFSEDIIVRKIVLAYDSTALLVEIGSCLGLWLGLSVVGIVDIVVLTILRTKKWFIKLYQYMLQAKSYKVTSPTRVGHTI